MSKAEGHYLQYLAPGFDRKAVLEELMADYGTDIWNFAYFLTRRKEMADDIAQETFLAAYDRLYAFRGEASPKSWLLSIARNKSLNALKSAFVRRVVLGDPSRHSKDAAPSAEHAALERLEADDLWGKVLTLPLKHREVLLLVYHYGLTIEETAASLGLSAGTVKSRLFRAKRRMAALLEVRRMEEE